MTRLPVMMGLLMACVAGPGGGAPGGSDRIPLALVGVNVVPMDSDTVLPNRTVIVSNGRILTIGPTSEVEIPVNATVVDGAGQYLLPGLVDAHVHLSESRAELPMYVSYGVTTIFDVGARVDDLESLVALRHALRNGQALGPELYMAGPIIDGPDPIVPSRSIVVRTPAEAEQAVERLDALGVDFAKVYNRVSPDALRALGDATGRLGLPLVGHIPRDAGALRAIDAGMDLIAHGEEFFFTYFGGPRSTRDLDRSWRPDMTLMPELVDRLVRGRVWVSPNLSFTVTNLQRIRDPEGFWGDSDLNALDPALVAAWRAGDPRSRDDLSAFLWREEVKYELVRELTRALQDGGVPLLLGTDSALVGVYPGRSAHLELREMVDAGLSPYEALAAGTVRAGDFIRSHVDQGARFGTVTEGARADLLVVAGNPLEDVTQAERITGLVLRGEWIAGERLAAMRAGRE